MLWEFSVFALSVLNFIALWLVNDHPDQVFWIVGIFGLILLIGNSAITKRTRFFVLLLVLVLGAVVLLPLIASPSESRAFMVLATGIFYLLILAGYRLRKYEMDRTAMAMVNLGALATLFCWYTSIYGWYLNIQISVWVIMAIYAVATFTVSYVLMIVNQLKIDKYQRILYSVILAYLMAGTIWIQNSWPFGYLTTGVVGLIIYHSGFDTVRNHFLQKLTVRKIAANIVFLVGASSLLLLATKWYPVM